MNPIILIVDDEEIIIKSISKLLRKQNFDVITCKTGSAAIEAVRNSNFGLLICDIRMPEVNGVETIRQIRLIRQQLKLSSIPEIVITGYAESDLNQEIEDLQVAEYIYKPFDINDFLNLVKKHVRY